MINGEKVFDAAERGDSLAVLNHFCEGLSGRNSFHVAAQLRLWGSFSPWMANGNWKSLATGANPYGLKPEDAVHVTALAGMYVHDNAMPSGNLSDFYGSPLMAIAGVYYWITGNGVTRRLYIQSLGLDLRPHEILPIWKRVNSAEYGPGIHHINDPFSINTFNQGRPGIWAAGLLGRVSGTVHGQLHIDGTGHWQFSGQYSLGKDNYAAYDSNRTFAQEVATKFLGGLGKVFGHADYDIEILGSMPLSFSGQR